MHKKESMLWGLEAAGQGEAVPRRAPPLPSAVLCAHSVLLGCCSGGECPKENPPDESEP